MDDLTIKEGFMGQRMIVLPNQVRKKLNENPITKKFFVTDLGYYPNANHHFRERIKGSKEYIFIYCVEGEGWLSYNKKKIKIKPNAYFIIPKNTRHAYGAENNNPWSIYWMHFDGTSVNELFQRHILNDTITDTVPYDNTVIKLFEQIFEIFNGGYAEYELEFANILSQSFISSFIYHDINKHTNTANSKDLVNSIKTFLNENLDKTFKTEELANEFNYSPSYLFSVFKKSTGYSLHHFFNLKKIQKACEYMNYTDYSIKEISFLLGFQDQFYFSRVFKKYMGISPKEYRKNI
ncbi:AraC family transcriptional regulator [Aegicerativicinus sediminis]|uniref:AraC family transcriptional regulator n=1 Tax=Aegicerativicinus sediminis TaxID=2893202 RepID=UPI001E61A809|nr:AraC family transcriptional regulator [Aegicerativicinus sediminis]